MALAQARELVDRLEAVHGIGIGAIEIVAIKTSGDTILNLPLSEAGGKGLFTKELDLALAQGNIEMAVHSAKDLPTFLPAGIEIAGYLPRADVRDAWISPHAAHPLKLPPGSVVGTASLRRGAMVRRLRPDVRIALLRGNVETRLAKVTKGEVAATLLALAGLTRLGLEAAATAVLDAREFVPAPGQGAIAITVRAGDDAVRAFLSPVLDAATGVALAA
ncbi:MAG: hydroxymethylbilane synthase, partial [Methylocella sp.]